MERQETIQKADVVLSRSTMRQLILLVPPPARNGDITFEMRKQEEIGISGQRPTGKVSLQMQMCMSRVPSRFLGTGHHHRGYFVGTPSQKRVPNGPDSRTIITIVPTVTFPRGMGKGLEGLLDHGRHPASGLPILQTRAPLSTPFRLPAHRVHHLLLTLLTLTRRRQKSQKTA